MNSKSVKFSQDITVYTTYNEEDYDRHCIDHVLYRLAYKRLSPQEYKDILVKLDHYKLSEMIVHQDSVENLRITF